MRFQSIASGSSGNCIYAGSDNTHLLMDVGISRKRTNEALHGIGLDLKEIDGIFITHEHSDHVNGLPVFAKRYAGPLYATKGTIAGRGSLAHLPFVPLAHDDELTVAGMRIRTFPTSHDVADPFGLHFTVEDAGGTVLDSVGWCTDTGVLTKRALEELRGCRVLGLEANHDVRMLATGPYPSYLKARVGGTRGHLSNDQCAEALRTLVTADTTTVVALHISEKNNLPSVAKAALSQAVPDGTPVSPKKGGAEAPPSRQIVLDVSRWSP